MKKTFCWLFAILLIASGSGSTLAQSSSPDIATMRSWVTQMKSADRGPFSRIRWYCDDGTVHPPRPYPCENRGGGVQHGEWSDHTKTLREHGYYVANVFATMDIASIVRAPGASDRLNQILIEQFLVAADDGWILRKARYYRGAFQEEDEQSVGRELLLGMTRNASWVAKGFLPLRMAVNVIPHGADTESAAAVRKASLTLSEQDKNFLPIRIKIHNKPDKGDAKRVREYAASVGNADLKARYRQLADAIDRLYTSESAVKKLRELAAGLPGGSRLGTLLTNGAAALAAGSDPVRRFEVSAKLMALLRDELSKFPTAELRLAALETSLALETMNFSSATALRQQLPRATRRQRLDWLEADASAIYGAGLISDQERKQLRSTFEQMRQSDISLGTYKKDLDYLARVPAWGTQTMRFHFYKSMQKLAEIEPLANRFIQDQLRGSPLFFYSTVLDSLVRDANQMVGVRSQLFGKDVGVGLRALNPGLARGTLRLSGGTSVKDFKSDGIYLLPETVAELPPVAGILTAGEGNPLSHVQLLARNLGIPNVGIDERLIPQLKAYGGKSVILAVSPAGSVQLTEDNGQLDHLFAQGSAAPQTLIRPDQQKLDLTVREFIPLTTLRAEDSGRIVGPKAAKLGELKHHYPEAVADGVAIPFGMFRQLLDQPKDDSGQSVYEWMVAEYKRLAAMPEGSEERRQATEAFRRELEEWILNADPGESFRTALRAAMQKKFGAEPYGVFVRSDTNVEDLPGFTGAGLNLTLPNVVGFDNVMKAIARVWASPFSERAFAWRQSHMDHPELVYPAILLLRSVPSDKSGVMVTQDIDTGDRNWLSVAVNEGVGGAVDGQAAESLRINKKTEQVRLLAQATAPTRRVLNPRGGVTEVTVSGDSRVLKPREIEQLVKLAQDLPQRFPAIKDAAGRPAPADIEFGFVGGKLRLYQIRPFLESAQASGSDYLKSLDRNMSANLNKTVSMNAIPVEAS
jgi:Pyruvate phosphate dikinase, AMP/ATP-binding domain